MPFVLILAACSPDSLPNVARPTDSAGTLNELDHGTIAVSAMTAEEYWLFGSEDSFSVVESLTRSRLVQSGWRTGDSVVRGVFGTSSADGTTCVTFYDLNVSEDAAPFRRILEFNDDDSSANVADTLVLVLKHQCGG